jgi:cell division protein FtsL
VNDVNKLGNRTARLARGRRPRSATPADVFEPADAFEPRGGEADERRGSKREGAGVGALLLAIVTAGALAHVAVRFEGLEVAYALGRERKVGADLDEQRRRLQIEIGMLKDPNRVVTIARDQLHMGPPAPDSIRRLGTGDLFVHPTRTADEGLAAKAAPPERTRSATHARLERLR